MTNASTSVFQGIVFDSLNQVVRERCLVLRSTYSEALADAEFLILNKNFNDAGGCSAGAYVNKDGVLMASDSEPRLR